MSEELSGPVYAWPPWVLTSYLSEAGRNSRLIAFAIFVNKHSTVETLLADVIRTSEMPREVVNYKSKRNSSGRLANHAGPACSGQQTHAGTESRS